MNKLFMFFPMNDENEFDKSDVIVKELLGTIAARKFAKSMLERHKETYTKVTIFQLDKKDTITAPFKLE